MARSNANLLYVNNPIGVSEVYSNVNSPTSSPAEVKNAAPVPPMEEKDKGSPVAIWLVMIGLFIVIILWARHSGGGNFGENFKNIRPSFFNILFVGAVVAVALPLFKLVGGVIPNASIRNYLQNAI